MLDYITMGMVIHEPLTGYDIKREIETGIGNFYTASYGNLYPALKRLTARGCLTMTEEIHGKRVKKYYKITQRGKEEFLEWLSKPLAPNAGSNALLAKIYFFGELPADIRKQRLVEYELHHQQALRQLEAMERRFTAPDADGGYFELSTLYLGLQHLQDTIRWFQHIEAGKPLSTFVERRPRP